MPIDSAILRDYNSGNYQRAINKLKANNDGESISLLAECYALIDQPEKAESLFKAQIQSNPNSASNHYNLGVFYSHQNRPNDAYLCYVNAWENDNTYTKAGETLVRMLSTAGYFNHAGQIAQTLLNNDQANPAAYKSYSRVLSDIGLADLAVNNLKKGVSLIPDGSRQLIPSLLMALNFSTATQQTIHSASRQWAKEIESKIRPFPTNKQKNDKIRIGYVSGDFKRHSVAYFIEPILRNHNKASFEIYCYSYTANADHITEQIKNLCDHWRNLIRLPSPKQCAEIIQKDNIDILIDLGGHTLTEALIAFAYKPAKHQVTYLGYPNTTGLSAIEYRITDNFADPDDQDQYYSEQLIRLKSGFLVFAPPEHSPEVKKAPHNTNGYVTFGSFNNFAKTNDQLIDLWSKILQRVPNAKLLLKGKLFNEDTGKQRIIERFARTGITPDRLILLGWEKELKNHLDLYRRVDICLDTFPYNGTTTTCEALYMGVPTVTLCGKDHRSRVGHSIFMHLGLTTLIAHTKREYIKKAIELATHLESLNTLRTTLRPLLVSSPLCDAVLTTQELENFYASTTNRSI